MPGVDVVAFDSVGMGHGRKGRERRGERRYSVKRYKKKETECEERRQAQGEKGRNFCNAAQKKKEKQNRTAVIGLRSTAIEPTTPRHNDSI